MLLPTPSTSHVSYDNVYEPSEDSYLFLDTLSSPSEIEWLQTRFSSAGTSLLVELGPGSGVVIAFLTAHARKIFGSDVLSLSVDVNWHACRATRTTVEVAIADERKREDGESTASPSTSADKRATKAGLVGWPETQTRTSSTYLTSLRGDLSSALRPHSADVMIFNPPYVPTESVPSLSSLTEHATKPTFEESSHLLAQSYAGGRDGMEVTERMLAQLPDALSARGVAYVLFCRGNRPEEVKQAIRAWDAGELEGVEGDEGEDGGRRRGEWHAETVGESGKTAGWEKLEIVRIWKE